MTDWLRVAGYSFLSLLAILAGWFLRSKYALAKYRRKAIEHIQDSQRGRRPLWVDPSNQRNEKDR